MNKYVITGGASCGKTTLVDCLKDRGFNVLGEVAREVIEEMRERDYDKAEEAPIRQTMIFERQLEREAQLNVDVVFLDRGLLDNIAYSNHLMGKVPDYFAEAQFEGRYDKIFALDMLPFVDDGLRIESGPEEAMEIHEKVIQAYEQFGYDIVRVPIFDGKDLSEGVGKRADYVLDRI